MSNLSKKGSYFLKSINWEEESKRFTQHKNATYIPKNLIENMNKSEDIWSTFTQTNEWNNETNKFVFTGTDINLNETAFYEIAQFILHTIELYNKPSCIYFSNKKKARQFYSYLLSFNIPTFISAKYNIPLSNNWFLVHVLFNTNQKLKVVLNKYFENETSFGSIILVEPFHPCTVGLTQNTLIPVLHILHTIVLRCEYVAYSCFCYKHVQFLDDQFALSIKSHHLVLKYKKDEPPL